MRSTRFVGSSASGAVDGLLALDLGLDDLQQGFAVLVVVVLGVEL